jgi:hypothetical protein
MPILDNPRWERFAQLIVSYLARPGEPNSHGKLYVAAGYCANGVGQPGGAAEANAHRLLKKDIIRNRVNELLAQSAKKAKVTIESITDEYNEARELARNLNNPATFLAASQAKAKLYKLEVNVNENINADSKTPQNSDDIAVELLADVGLHEPDEDAKRRALEAYDLMIAKLERIRDDVLGFSQH